MTQQRLRISALALFAANLAPLAGVVFWEWSVSSVIILYWFENVVIGVINVARMAVFSPAGGSIAAVIGTGRAAVIGAGRAAAIEASGSGASRALPTGPIVHGIKLLLIPFFVLHYFFFCAGHGVFVFGMFPDDAGYFAETTGIGFLGTLGRAIEIFSTPLALAAFALAASHVVSFFVNYIGGGEFRRLDIMRLMTMPYGRIVVLHVTIILGGFATLALAEPLWLVVIFVLVKIVVDLKLHFREHMRAAAD